LMQLWIFEIYPLVYTFYTWILLHVYHHARNDCHSNKEDWFADSVHSRKPPEDQRDPKNSSHSDYNKARNTLSPQFSSRFRITTAMSQNILENARKWCELSANKRIQEMRDQIANGIKEQLLWPSP
jgi:hypothetical protein